MHLFVLLMHVEWFSEAQYTYYLEKAFCARLELVPA